MFCGIVARIVLLFNGARAFLPALRVRFVCAGRNARAPLKCQMLKVALMLLYKKIIKLILLLRGRLFSNILKVVFFL